MTDKNPWQLVFYPIDPHWCPAQVTTLRDCLTELRLIGDPVVQDPVRRFLIGSAFLQYVSFMGCAPAVQFSPEAGADFIHWYISPCLPTPRWIIDRQQALPRCQQCRARISNWRDQIDSAAVNTATTSVVCMSCQCSNALSQLDWRHGAGQARQFISVLNIYPKEALPTEALLTMLQQHTGTTWDYFYCQREPIAE